MLAIDGSSPERIPWRPGVAAPHGVSCDCCDDCCVVSDFPPISKLLANDDLGQPVVRPPPQPAGPSGDLHAPAAFRPRVCLEPGDQAAELFPVMTAARHDGAQAMILRLR